MHDLRLPQLPCSHAQQPVEESEAWCLCCRRLLRVQLTDGKATCCAAEYKHTPQLHDELPPGTKLALTNVQIKLGVLLLDQKTVKVGTPACLWGADATACTRNAALQCGAAAHLALRALCGCLAVWPAPGEQRDSAPRVGGETGGWQLTSARPDYAVAPACGSAPFA